MSQRLAANKRPIGQTLQTSSGSTAQMQDSRKLGVPKRKPRNFKRSVEASTNSVQEWCGDEGDNSTNTYCRPEAATEDLKQIMKKNVFFDSYYPKLQGDFSEDCDGSRKSQASTIGIYSNIFSSETLKVGDPSKTEFNFHEKTKDKVSIPFEKAKDNKKCPDQQSTKSRQTFDSNTYTLQSSDHESDSRISAEKGNEPNIDSPSDEPPATSEEKVDVSEKEDEKKSLLRSAEESREALSAVDCFAHLYKRIETLEDLLQQTLAKSVEQKCKCLEHPKKKEKTQPSKTKFSASKTSEPKKPAGGSPRASGDPSKAHGTEEKEKEDTDNELRSIKKRLRVLEKKLKQAKTSSSAHSEKKGFEAVVVDKSSEISEERVSENYCCRMYNLVNTKESDYTRPLSDTDYFLPSEMLVLSTRSDLLSEPESSDWNLKNEVKKKIISNCKRIKKKCSSIISSRRNKSHTPKIIKCSEIVSGDSGETTYLCRSLSARIRGDKNKGPILYVKCPHEHGHKTQVQKRPKKKILKKRKHLCKKNSRTNFVSGQGEGTQEWDPGRERNDANTSASLECGHTSASDLENDKNVHSKSYPRNGWSKSPWVSAPVPGPGNWPPDAYCMTIPYPFSPHSHCNECAQKKNIRCRNEFKRSKPIKKTSAFRNPMEIIKRGGKIKIPILFEEVCKTFKAKKPAHKSSNVSMRFVLVERDPKHPLKKLIKKLSHGKTINKAEQYVFGVSKCCCEKEVHEFNAIREKSLKRRYNGV